MLGIFPIMFMFLITCTGLLILFLKAIHGCPAYLTGQCQVADSTFITWVNCFLQYMQFSMVPVALIAILFVFGTDFFTVLVCFHIYIYGNRGMKKNT